MPIPRRRGVETCQTGSSRKECDVPLDPQIEAALFGEEAADAPTFSLGVEEARAAEYDFIELCGPLVEMASVRDRRVAVDGGEIGVRIYTPPGTAPFGGFVFFHGGGWVAGDLETMDRVCRNFAAGADCVVASVDYRRAPEHRFPTAAEDCYAATRWVADHAGELGIDPARIAVGGDSAGGNLTAVTTLMARDRGGPALAFQLMIYPVTDGSLDTASYHECAEGYGLTRPMMEWFWEQYVPETDARSHPHASPLRAPSHAGLPPALVQIAGYDPLRDEGRAYAGRLRDAGVETSVACYDGLVHGYLQMATIADAAHAATDDAIAALRTALRA
jgi:acetyl esterase